MIGDDGNDAWHDSCHHTDHDDGSRGEKDDQWVETNDGSHQMHFVLSFVEFCEF